MLTIAPLKLKVMKYCSFNQSTAVFTDNVLLPSIKKILTIAPLKHDMI